MPDNDVDTASDAVPGARSPPSARLWSWLLGYPVLGIVLALACAGLLIGLVGAVAALISTRDAPATVRAFETQLAGEPSDAATPALDTSVGATAVCVFG